MTKDFTVKKRMGKEGGVSNSRVGGDQVGWCSKKPRVRKGSGTKVDRSTWTSLFGLPNDTKGGDHVGFEEEAIVAN